MYAAGAVDDDPPRTVQAVKAMARQWLELPASPVTTAVERAIMSAPSALQSDDRKYANLRSTWAEETSTHSSNVQSSVQSDIHPDVLPVPEYPGTRVPEIRGTADDGPGDGRAEALVEAWNSLTQPPIPRCLQLTPRRRTHCAARLRERPLEEWRTVIARLADSAFCRGENDRAWMATFDWLIESADNAVKVLEGKYDHRRPPGAPRSTSVESTEVQPAESSSWEECKARHQGACNGRLAHATQMQLDSIRAAADQAL